ncbi:MULTISPECIES: hypothetical protein [unclassified Sporosarcina]|uniref:hypothetical protein n=1 Tax=unclassified Sporosarcina TaxID=2647733 RepID=UPI001A91CF41|nr:MULTISPECIES: hypothetical protein [unclassified Sporosarcina]MBO0589267.1 hypothetical protein [Sporosarcina sp. E16_8]MBO0601974.1 hypothetical protein [Sporosarcina sp. E16_3]
MIQWLTYIAIVGFVVLLGIYIIGKKRSNKGKGTNPFDFGATSSTWKVNSNEYAQTAYTQSIKTPLLKGIILRIRMRIETLSVYDEYTLRKEVMRIVFTIATLIITIVLAVLIVRPSWLIIFWVFLGVVFLAGVMLDFFVYRVEARLLNQLKEFNNRFRYFYQQSKMVDEAVYESIQHAGPEMRVQADRIYHILTNVDPEAELAKYEEVAPSRFLKIIAGLAVLVKDQGDVINERGSAFLKGLTGVNQELNSEIMYRSKLTYKMRGLTVLSLIPIFGALPIQNWAISTFPVMKTFYESRVGFLAEVLVYGISLLSYFLIRKMREINEAKYQATTKRYKWEKWTLEKVPFLKAIVNGFTPTYFSKEHFKLKKLLKDANSPLKIEWLTLHRMLLTTSGFLLLTIGFWYAHERQEHSTLYSVVPATLFAGNVTDEDYAVFEEQTAFDRQIIEDMREMEGLSSEKLQAHIAAQLGIDNVRDIKIKQATDRISQKWLVVQNSFLKWWEVLVAILAGCMMWMIPVWILQFQRLLRTKDMENEVHQYLILISILKEFERMSVYSILTWLERFGVVFKDPLQEVLQIYDSGPEEALDELGEQISFEPFNQIIERLKLSLIRISIKEAFDDIDMEREFYLEQRTEANQRSLEEKGSWANMLAGAPMSALTFLYLVGPLIYSSVVESKDMLTRL